MTGTRPFPRTTVIIAFGPIIGAIALFAMVTPMTGPFADPEPLDFLWRGLLLYLVFGWGAGLLPAIASALVWRFAISEAWSFRRRALAAVLVGFFAGTFLIWPFMAIFFGPYAPDFRFNLVSGLCGAISLCATALPGGRKR